MKCAETLDVMAGLENRMKIMNTVRCILDYDYSEELKSMIPEKEVLDNLIVAVLLYICEKSQNKDCNCTLDDVKHFLSDLSFMIPQYAIDTSALAEYILSDVLLHDRSHSEYSTYFNKSGVYTKMPIHLIVEEKGNYRITDEVRDLFLCTQVVGAEIDYYISSFKVKNHLNNMEILERNNWTFF